MLTSHIISAQLQSTAACETPSASCSARTRCVRKTRARDRESHSTAPTSLHTFSCAPRLPPLPANAPQSRGSGDVSLTIEPVNLRPQRHLEQIRNADVSPPDHFAVTLGNENRIVRRRLHAPQSHFHLRRSRRIPKFTGKRSQPRNIGRLRTPNAQVQSNSNWLVLLRHP